MTKTVSDFGQVQITCGGIKLVLHDPNYLSPTWLVKDVNNKKK